MNHYGCIYGLLSPSNKWYIGQTTCIDPMRYITITYKYGKGAGRCKIQNAINKYGFDSFKIFIFVYLEDSKSLDLAETGFIELYDSISYGYNIKLGGCSSKMSEETKEKLRISHTGKVCSLDTREKMRNSRIDYLSNISKDILSKRSEKYEYEVRKPDGELIYTTNLLQFSRENNIRSNHLSDRGISRGWRLISKKSLDLIV